MAAVSAKRSIVVIMMNANDNDNDNDSHNDDDNDCNSSERHPERHRGGNYRRTESKICIVENPGLLGDEEESKQRVCLGFSRNLVVRSR